MNKPISIDSPGFTYDSLNPSKMLDSPIPAFTIIQLSMQTAIISHPILAKIMRRPEVLGIAHLCSITLDHAIFDVSCPDC